MARLFRPSLATIVRLAVPLQAMNESVLSTHALSKRYGERTVVDRLELQVDRGEVFGFLGPNGAGKTTTIRMALGLVEPSAGSVALFGSDVRTHGSQVLPRVGALVESPALYGYMTGRDNLRAVGRVLGGISESRIDEVLEIIHLRGRDRDRVNTYSLGMKQRLGLGLAMLNDPELYILDEPANGLDPAGIAEIRDLLRELATQGRTVFISSHVLSEIQQICDRVAIIQEGRLVTVSTVARLTESGGEFVVIVERPEAALELVRTQPWGGNARLEDLQLVVPSPSGRGRDLVQFLAGHGHWPDVIRERQQSLEQIFLDLTGREAR
ncbi:MAG: ABC transporter ATP-binding protein [Candidatus Dormibacteraeota bacterium]|nr:ABC transporter ATP-binding protein [Candidatus Dormibacteraeota bacterium]